MASVRSPRWRRRTLRLPSGPWRQPVAILGSVLALGWLVVIVIGPLIVPYDALEQAAERLQPPSREHLLGTDELGRDVLSRVILGARISIPLSMLLVAGALTIGCVLGAISGYFGGVWDQVIMRFVDLFFAFPLTILAMAVAASLGPSLRNAVIAGIVASWPPFARVTRGAMLAARNADYVSAAFLLGASPRRIITVEISRNVAGPVVVLAALEVATAMLLLSGLSFLGLGARPPTPEWGSMVSDGARHFGAWWIGVSPGVAILTVAVSFNLLGDALRDVLDPSTKDASARRAA
jgi:peptide/nickel transport system permease protein